MDILNNISKVEEEVMDKSIVELDVKERVVTIEIKNAINEEKVIVASKRSTIGALVTKIFKGENQRESLVVKVNKIFTHAVQNEEKDQVDGRKQHTLGIFTYHFE